MRPAPLILGLLVVATAACTSGEPSPSPTAAGTTTPTTISPSTTTTMATVVRSVEAMADGLGDAYFPELGNRGYDARHYTIAITTDPATDVLTGTVTIDAAATADLDTFNLDFVGFDILELTVDDRPATFDRSAVELTIRPAAPIAQGDSFSTKVTYSGPAAPFGSIAIGFPLGWNRTVDGSYVASEPDGARSWFPVNDHPLDKATYRFEITVPDPLMAAANGRLVETITDLGWATWVWQMDDEMASYLATVVVGDYLVVPDPAASATAGFEIRHVLPRAVAAEPPAPLTDVGLMASFLEERFGPYPHDLWGVVLVDGFPAALETQTLSLVSISFEREQLELVLVHELAHEWFGNSVSPARWQDVWLNEGFATYAQWMWLEERAGRATLDEVVSAERAALVEADLAPPAAPPPTDLFNRSVYQRGGIALHEVRRLVGDDVFFAILQTYHRRYAGAVATTEDFIDVAVELGGEPVRAVLDAWLFSDEVPPLGG